MGRQPKLGVQKGEKRIQTHTWVWTKQAGTWVQKHTPPFVSQNMHMLVKTKH